MTIADQIFESDEIMNLLTIKKRGSSLRQASFSCVRDKNPPFHLGKILLKLTFHIHRH